MNSEEFEVISTFADIQLHTLYITILNWHLGIFSNSSS